MIKFERRDIVKVRNSLIVGIVKDIGEYTGNIMIEGVSVKYKGEYRPSQLEMASEIERRLIKEMLILKEL